MFCYKFKYISDIFIGRKKLKNHLKIWSVDDAFYMKFNFEFKTKYKT